MLTIIVEFAVPDIEKATQALQENTTTLGQVSEQTKVHGCQHHAFYTDGLSLYAIDVWETEEGFLQFFNNNLEVQAIMIQAGVSHEPKITVLRPIDVPGTF